MSSKFYRNAKFAENKGKPGGLAKQNPSAVWEGFDAETISPGGEPCTNPLATEAVASEKLRFAQVSSAVGLDLWGRMPFSLCITFNRPTE